MVEWKEVCKPLAHGGLGIRSIEKGQLSFVGKVVMEGGGSRLGFLEVSFIV